MPLKDLVEFSQSGCARCDDFHGEAADHSIGGLGAKKGHSTVISWTPENSGLLDNAVAWNLLETTEEVHTIVHR